MIYLTVKIAGRVNEYAYASEHEATCSLNTTLRTLGSYQGVRSEDRKTRGSSLGKKGIIEYFISPIKGEGAEFLNPSSFRGIKQVKFRINSKDSVEKLTEQFI